MAYSSTPRGLIGGRLSAVVRYTLARAINPSIAHGMSAHGALTPLHRTSGRSN